MGRYDVGGVMARFYDLKADYNLAKSSVHRRYRRLPGSGSNADYHYRSEADYLRIMEHCRDLDRNDMIVGQGITRFVDNVLQSGFTPDPSTPSIKLNSSLKDLWSEWAGDPEQCDLQGEHDFHAQEQLILRQTIVDGDHFVLPTRGLKLQSIEAHRVRTPSGTTQNVVHGVKLDRHRRRLEYWITKDDIDPLATLRLVGEVDKVPARDASGVKQVLHVLNPRRTTQTRGISALCPVGDVIGMHDDLQFAALLTAQLQNFFAVIAEKEQPMGPGPGTLTTEPSAQFGNKTLENNPDGTQRRMEDLAPGLFYEGLPGEKLQGFSPTVPGDNFGEHSLLILTIIAVNLGVPVAVLLLDPTKTNFSGWRGAMDQARIGFRQWQAILIQRFHAHVYRWFLREMASRDRMIDAELRSLGPAGLKVDWNVPSWPYIEPVKDITAGLMEMRDLRVPPSMFHASQGRDWERTYTRFTDDWVAAAEYAATKAAELNKRPEFTDDPIRWRELIGVPLPATGGDILQAANQQDAADETTTDQPARGE